MILLFYNYCKQLNLAVDLHLKQPPEFIRCYPQLLFDSRSIRSHTALKGNSSIATT